MGEDNNWDEANGQFLDFVNDIMGQNPDDEIIKQSGQMLSYFSHFLVSIKKNEEPEFKYFYQLVMVVDESEYSANDQQKIVSKVMEILRNVYPDVNGNYKCRVFGK
ncbi:MAG TPA: hypothetical protein VJ963_07985 [Bacteroidales bacterium]|nr:hypothetical protein [Bacteroidales bacterium]